MHNILLLGSGTQSLALVNSLRRLSWSIFILTEMHSNYGDASIYVKRVFRRVFISDEDDCKRILSIVDQYGIDVVVPMGDDSAAFLSRVKDVLKEKVKFRIPDYEDFVKGYDKNNLMNLCERKGYPHPNTIDLSVTDIDDEKVRDAVYPCMLKPNCTTGGRGMIKVNSYEELMGKYPKLHSEYGEYHLQKYIKSGGRQVKVQLYVGKKQQLLASSVLHKVRWYPNEAGASCCALSIKDEKIVSICHQILKDIHWIGFADFDTIEDPDTGELLIMEINPRLPACIKCSFEAGVDWGQIMVNDAMGESVYDFTYKEGVCLRHLGFDILWYVHAKDRQGVIPSWWKFVGKDVYYQDMNGWTDIWPFLSGTFNNVKKLCSPSFRKKKFNGETF